MHEPSYIYKASNINVSRELISMSKQTNNATFLLRRFLFVLILNVFIPEKLEPVLQIWCPTAQIFKLGEEELNLEKEETSESPTAGGFFSPRQEGSSGCRSQQQDRDE